MDNHKAQLLRRLKVKCSEAEEELLGVEIFLDDAVPLFVSAIEEYCLKYSLNNPLDNISKSEDVEEYDEFGSGFYSVFRKIAIKSHPDKNKGDQVDAYIDATKAKKEKNINKLISVSKELKVELTELTYSDIKDIENSIKRTEEKIKKIKTSYPYIWYFSSDSKRKHIISSFVESKV